MSVPLDSTRGPVAFTGVNVIPMDADRILEDRLVLVGDGRITSVGADPPDGAALIDGAGGFLMPGLADMHTHLHWRDPDPAHLVLYLAEGVTTVRSMNGTVENAEWRQAVADGMLFGPTIFTAGPTLVAGLEDEDPEEVAAAPIYIPDSAEDAAAEVRRQAAGWPDLVKVYDGLTPDQYLAAIAAANEAGIYVAGHALDQLPIDTLVSSGIDEIAHIDELNMHHWIGFPGEPGFALDYDAIPATAEAMVENDIAIVSNLVADEVMADLIADSAGVLARPEYAVVRPELLQSWRTEGRHLERFVDQGEYRRDLELPFLKTLIAALHAAGVTVTVGTDSSTLEGSVPSNIHRDLELLVDAGLSPFDALAAGTRNAGLIAKRMGRDGAFGTIEPGQRADLILLAGNPLERVGHTRDRIGVMVRGAWYPQAELDRRVAEFVATYS